MRRKIGEVPKKKQKKNLKRLVPIRPLYTEVCVESGVGINCRLPIFNFIIRRPCTYIRVANWSAAIIYALLMLLQPNNNIPRRLDLVISPLLYFPSISLAPIRSMTVLAVYAFAINPCALFAMDFMLLQAESRIRIVNTLHV